MELKVIEYRDGALRFVDQTRLPAEVHYLETREWRDVKRAIKHLAVRGAPLIGIAAAYGLALAARRGEVAGAAQALASARPTAANLRWAIDRVLAAGGDVAAIEAEARRIHEEQIAADEAMAALGASLIPVGATVLTHCNTGALATGGIGTALGVTKQAWHGGRLRRVIVDETRPLLQGARLTAWELQQLAIPFDVIADGAAASLIARGDIDAVVVGADRIARNGDTANKVGTYALALAAGAHGVPFYVVAPVSTIDMSTASGDGIAIEERAPDEVLSFAGVRTAPDGASALNPAFDITPARLIAAIVTEAGVLRAPYDRAVANIIEQPVTAR